MTLIRTLASNAAAPPEVLETRIVSTRQTTLARWDDFARPDSRLDTSNSGRLPSGQPWVLGFGPPATAANLKIVAGKLRLDSAGASYLWTTGPQPAAEMAVEFLFEPGPTGNASGVGLICSKQTTLVPAGPTGVATNSIHLVFHATTWAIGVFNGVTLSQFATGTYTVPLDGTRLRGAMRRIGPDRLQIDTPDGVSQVVRDRRIPQWWGPTVLVEHFQPTATFAVDARPVILSYAVGDPEPRDMPLDLPTGVSGIPGAVASYTGALAGAAGTIRYVPIEVTDPITVTSLQYEVTVAAPAAATARYAIVEADQGWQPTRLLQDLGDKPIDVIGVFSTPLATPLTLSRGRYLLANRNSVAGATFRTIGYGIPGSGGLRTTMSATPFVQALQVTEAYGAFTDPPTAWSTPAATVVTGWITYAILTWTPAT